MGRIVTITLTLDLLGRTFTCQLSTATPTTQQAEPPTTKDSYSVGAIAEQSWDTPAAQAFGFHHSQ
jgi:hypothetical protein